MLDTLVKTNNQYIVALYIRLSREDKNKPDKEESESIVNQKALLTSYVEEHGFTLHDIYVDDGFSGTSFDRPDFNRMIKDIEDGKVNTVITKDLSRLGRDYIVTGEYLEKYFPSHKIRYIAITDNIDTLLDNSSLDMAPFKAVFNDMYAKDISKKIKAALYIKQKEGKWVGGCTPLGYKSDPKDKNHLIIDEKEAWIVKKIFDLALKGKGTVQIKDILYKEKVPTAYQIRNAKNFYGENTEKGIWSAKTIKTILTNQLYTGDMVQNRRSRISYKVRKIVKNAKQDWIVVKNTHEPIIDKETFKAVSKIIKKTSQKNTKKQIRLLDGLLVCHECGHNIGVCAPRKSDNRTYIVCNYYRQHSKLNLCTSHGFNYDYLEKAVINTIRDICLKVLSEKELQDYSKSIELESPKTKLINKKKVLEETIANNQEKLDQIYLDKLEAKISDSMYERLAKKITNDLNKASDELVIIKERIEDIKDEFDIPKECNKIIKDFMGMKNPTRQMMLRLIDKIEVHKDKQLDIYFNFREMNYF